GHFTVRKSRGVKARRLLRVLVEPETDRVLRFHLWCPSHASLTARFAISHHGVDAPGFRGLFQEPHRDVDLQVLEFLEVDATAAGLHLAELRGIPLDEVAVLVAGTNVEAVFFFPRGE